jgi:DNA primase catalytic core
MFVRNYQDVIATIEEHLEDYLKQYGIDTSGMFLCINPDHNDRNPSCSIQGNGKRTFHCFSCGAAGNIFKAANFLEGLPLVGKPFLLETVTSLANRFSIPLDMDPPTEDELYEIDTYRAYDVASHYIVAAQRGPKVQEELAKRAWDDSLCLVSGVGTVTSFKDFREHLKSCGFSATFLDDIDLGRRDLFSDESLIFTIRDEYGRSVGFASKNLLYDGNKNNGAKYVNQKTTGNKCNIYQKGKRLYGFDYVLKKYGKRPQPIYVYEGYPDVLTSRAKGCDCCVALGGTAFTADHLFLLKDHGFYNIILCLDGDAPGQSMTAEILDKVLSGHKDINVKVISLPEGEDPDSMIRLRGVDAFLGVKVWSAFDWRLAKFENSEDDEAVCDAMIPLIVSEPSCIRQEKMANSLARATGIDSRVIQAEVQRLQNDRASKKAFERKDIIDRMALKIQRDPESAETAISEAQVMLYDLMRQYDEDHLSEDATLARLLQQKTVEENKDDKFAGYILGEDLKYIQDALNGEWKQDVFGLLGGRENVGKSALLVKVAYELATHAENNAVVIYHSIDDTAEQIQPRFITVAEGSRQLEINQVANPNYYMAQGVDIVEKRERGYAIIQSLVKQGRLILKDANDGMSVSFVESLMRYYRTKYPDRNIVYVLDNFHKLGDLAGAETNREKYRAMSQKVKNLCGQYHLTAICTAEYTKMAPGERPSNNNLAETAQLGYDANFIIHLYNDLNDMRDKATDYHVAPVAGELVKLPRIELSFSKNKISTFKGKLYLNFFPACSDFVGVRPELVVADREARKNASGDNDDNSDPFFFSKK